jgi:wyosine [tRNA(Phe)-imidazoG37] synthetase (radical SAM superfamily)
MQSGRFAFYEPEVVLASVRDKLMIAAQSHAHIDYLSFVPDGEPTLDVHLGHTINLLRPFRVKIAVITNSSLMSRRDVRKDLMQADWVSVKVDAVREEVWRKLDRPHRSLELAAILEGLRAFAADYPGVLVSETMLVRGANDDIAHVIEIAEFLHELKPSCAYLAIPTRPPAEAWVRPPDEATLNRAYQAMCSRLEKVELLITYEGDNFFSAGDAERDLLSILAVHPMRQEAVEDLLRRVGANRSLIEDLMARQWIVAVDYAGHRYYLRNLELLGGQATHM